MPQMMLAIREAIIISHYLQYTISCILTAFVLTLGPTPLSTLLRYTPVITKGSKIPLPLWEVHLREVSNGVIKCLSLLTLSLVFSASFHPMSVSSVDIAYSIYPRQVQ